ncbi:hypothetical protein ACJX0J_034764 [Zea mays]
MQWHLSIEVANKRTVSSLHLNLTMWSKMIYCQIFFCDAHMFTFNSELNSITELNGTIMHTKVLTKYMCYFHWDLSGSLFGGFASLEERDNISFAVANLLGKLCQSTVVASAIFGNYNFGFHLLLYWEGSNSTVNAGDFAPTQLSEMYSTSS